MVRKEDVDGSLGGLNVGKEWIGFCIGESGKEMVSCTSI